jgi:hypothetical protein
LSLVSDGISLDLAFNGAGKVFKVVYVLSHNTEHNFPIDGLVLNYFLISELVNIYNLEGLGNVSYIF